MHGKLKKIGVVEFLRNLKMNSLSLVYGLSCKKGCNEKCKKVKRDLRYKKQYTKKKGLKYEPYTKREPTKLHIYDTDYIGQVHVTNDYL